MKFNKIVCVDNTKLNDHALEQLQKYSESSVENYTAYPESEAEILKRIGNAQAVLVSWRTQLTAGIIEQCENLKYIGMACSLYDTKAANVAVDFARERGIEVTGIFDYGDPGVVEFIISELIRLLHGFGEKQWQDIPMELTGRKIGIIGLGTTGQMLAKCLLPFGTDLYYYSRTRKKEWETRGVSYLSLDKLLEHTEIISLHLPKNTRLLHEREFEIFGKGKVLVSTSLGLPFEEEAFQKWLRGKGNFTIVDGDAGAGLSKRSLQLENLIAYTESAGWSRQTRNRLSEKVLEKLKNFTES
ncbi:NAD(P)-dependent oxidoreductase [Salegentibacter sp. F14]